MKIQLAGFNVDYDLLRKLAAKSEFESALTPEVFSAAYARISRSPKSVTELRRLARKQIEKARASNRSIIFGMGHHSVAEHAVFNFDIMGISRLLAEEVERFRLNSYTEKSQRYIKLEGNFVLPEKIRKSPFENPFKKLIKEGIALYHDLYDRIITSGAQKLGRKPNNDEKKSICLKANEDARYVLSLSQKTQLGETINARNLELLIRRFASSELAEARECGRKMFRLVKKIAPSILLFCKENDFDKLTYPSLKDIAPKGSRKKHAHKAVEVSLVDWTRNADTLLIGAILHSASKLTFAKAYETAKAMDKKRKRAVFEKVFTHMELYDTVLREFEHVQCTFSIIVSASCFAQLKRHRMATLTYQPYDPELDVTVPQSVRDAGMYEKFKSFMSKTNALYSRMRSRFPLEAQYILTNAHRRSVLLSVNARELYHMSRLREDEHAQWEIRGITKEMVRYAKRKMPLTLLVVGGKDAYPEIYKSVFGTYPKVIQPELPS